MVVYTDDRSLNNAEAMHLLLLSANGVEITTENLHPLLDGQSHVLAELQSASEENIHDTGK